MVASLQSSLYTAALALCVFSTGILGHRRVRAGRPLTFFTAYLGVESCGFAFELLAVHPDMPFKALWLGLLMISSLLVAPILWLAIEETLTGRRASLRSLSAREWCVIGVGSVLCLPLLVDAHAGTGWAPPPGPRAWHWHWIHEGMIGCIAIFSLQVPYFLIRARRLMLAHLDQTPAATRTWLNLPLWVVGTTWILGMLRVVQCAAHAPAQFTVLFALIDVSVTIIALYLILRRGFFTPVAPVAVEAEAEAAGSVSDETVKYRKSCLDPATRARIRTKLDRAFTRDAVHRDSLLSLRTLSRDIGEKAHYVSQVINQDLGVSFYDLVNRHRVEAAQQLLCDRPEQTVLEIALAVGFNSKSTFNTAYRRHTGRTPSEFRSDRSPVIKPGPAADA